MKRKSVLAALASGALIGGCATQTQVEPAAQARQVERLGDAAVAERAGVDMLVQADTWPGDPAVTELVTPLRVHIENEGAQPLRIRYSEVVMIGPGGEIYRALPPFSMEGRVAATPSGPYAPIERPSFGHGNFTVAEPYRSVYPTLAVAADPFLGDTYYYDRYYGYWEQVGQLPTPEMLAQAIPEGVLAPGGQVSGFIYFEKIPNDQRLRLKYRANLVDARSGVTFARVTIPLIANPAG